ncbi:MAG: type II toxin-antitoxin system RelE/ParE family toxin [Defluviitaleaceae bacterium]|nr:type II toxin-antitoxin system RelE/ParE family toxin [Defluviitaleaceae bacterium]
MTPRTQNKPPEFSSKAAKVIEAMDRKTQDRIHEGILHIPKGNIQPMQGSGGLLRLRIGKWRAIFRWIDDGQIFVQKVSTRGGAYKGE